ncbi:MAG: ABC transporter ATP-binding protein [Methanomassiliicoccaceae archaeon]|nr:ABC transporter ATP-binding protein [Methanomassiliicoccaceae archaeon]
MKLSVSSVSFSYGDGMAVDGVSFDAENGEVIGIIGQNGCGKTTLLKCVNSLLRPVSGTVMIDEKDVLSMPRREIARNIGAVSQSTTIVFPYNVLDMVMMGRYPAKASFEAYNDNDLNIVQRSMAETGVEEFADRAIDELSGGERQRVLIARALAQEPNILLLDEPTLHLDINHQFDLMELVKKLAAERNMMIIVVTHDIVLAARFCDRLIMMERGKIVTSGRTEDVLTSENLARVFGIDARISYDERINGLNVFIVGKAGGDPKADRETGKGNGTDGRGTAARNEDE